MLGSPDITVLIRFRKTLISDYGHGISLRHLEVITGGGSLSPSPSESFIYVEVNEYIGLLDSWPGYLEWASA